MRMKISVFLFFLTEVFFWYFFCVESDYSQSMNKYYINNSRKTQKNANRNVNIFVFDGEKYYVSYLFNKHRVCGTVRTYTHIILYLYLYFSIILQI